MKECRGRDDVGVEVLGARKRTLARRGPSTTEVAVSRGRTRGRRLSKVMTLVVTVSKHRMPSRREGSVSVGGMTRAWPS
jgi:hypothetical protein